MQVTIDGKNVDCDQLDVVLNIGSSGLIAVQDMSNEHVFQGEELSIAIERDEPPNIEVIKDYRITVRLTKIDGQVISRSINSAQFIELVRDHFQDEF